MRFELDIDRRNLSDETLLNDLAEVADRLRTKSPTADQYTEHGRFNASTLIRRFRGWRPALVKAGLAPVHHNGGINPQDALEDLRAVADRLGRSTVTTGEYSSLGKYSDAPLRRIFGSWNAALEAAGLGGSKRPWIPTDELFENLETMWRALGRQPKYGEVAKPLSAFSAGVYESRFGSWRKALEAFVAQVRSDQEQPTSSAVGPAGPSTPMIPAPVRRAARAVNWRLRFLVMQRDGFRCCVCGSSPAKGHVVRLQVDHVLPWSKGGKTTFDNLQTLCEACNIGKSDLGHEPVCGRGHQ